MSDSHNADSPDEIEIDLRNANFAAFLAWFWPGAGHLYQGRTAKGILFMVCILSTWFFGLFIGGGKVVYAAWNGADWRWQYVCQLGVGAPALPALVHAYWVGGGREPLFGGFMAPPHDRRPEGPLENGPLAQLHHRLHAFFEIGTLYTVIAGLLNILAVYDAYAGPVLPEAESKEPPDDDDDKDDDAKFDALKGGKEKKND